MKKALLATVAIIVIGGGVLFWATRDSKAPSSKTDSKTASTQTYGAKDACNYLTQDIANVMLGAGANKGDNTPGASSDDVSVSTCTYTSATDGTLESAKNVHTATLLLRAPLTDTGAESNKEPFANQKEGAVSVAGYGEKAYWDPAMGQFNVLQKDSWLIMSVGPAQASQRTQDDAQKMAQAILANY